MTHALVTCAQFQPSDPVDSVSLSYISVRRRLFSCLCLLCFDLFQSSCSVSCDSFLINKKKMQGESGTLKRMKKKLTTFAGKSRDDEDDLPDDSDDKKLTRRRIKRKLIKLKEKLGEELQEESESARERLKERIVKLSEKLKKDDDDDEMFDDFEQEKLGIRDRIARLGEKLCEDRRTVASSDGDSLTSEERVDVEDKDGDGDKRMLGKIGQRIRDRSDQVQRVFYLV